jgi:outer membrane protein assembly factor BamB
MPSSGTNLKPEDGAFTVDLTVEVPDASNQNYYGEIKIVNNEKVSNHGIIPIYLSTSKDVHPWPMKGQNSRHTGLSIYSTAENPLIEKWRFMTDWPIDSGPVIGADGTIYFGGWDNYLHAINPDGSEKWRFDTGDIIDGCIPAIDDSGTIYVCNIGGYVFAVNPDSSQKWIVHLDSIRSSPCIGDNGIIYVAARDLTAIHPNGTILWTYETDGSIYSSPAIGLDGTIYIGGFTGIFYAINPDGTLKWMHNLGGNIRGSASIANDGTVYIGGGDGELFAFNPDDGSVIWHYVFGVSYMSPAIDEDGILYFGIDNWLFRAVYPNGTVKWSYDLYEENRTGFWKSSAAISSDGTIYVGANIKISSGGGGEIIAFNPDGTIRFRKVLSNWVVYSSPAIDENGIVYICSSHDTFYEGTRHAIGYLHAFGGPVGSNQPPQNPIIEGPLEGSYDREIYYNFTSNDPDNNPVSFYIEWGDGTADEWTGGRRVSEAASGETIYIPHTYQNEGQFTIRAKARDVMGAESDWSTLVVTMPKPKLMDLFLDWISERFPIIYQLLNLII